MADNVAHASDSESVGRPQGAHWLLKGGGDAGSYAMACWCSNDADHDEDDNDPSAHPVPVARETGE